MLVLLGDLGVWAIAGEGNKQRLARRKWARGGGMGQLGVASLVGSFVPSNLPNDVLKSIHELLGTAIVLVPCTVFVPLGHKLRLNMLRDLYELRKKNRQLRSKLFNLQERTSDDDHSSRIANTQRQVYLVVAFLAGSFESPGDAWAAGHVPLGVLLRAILLDCGNLRDSFGGLGRIFF